MPDFIPRSEPQLTIWLSNHQTEIATVGATVGLAAADITGEQCMQQNLWQYQGR